MRMPHLERLVDRGEQVLSEVRDNVEQTREVLLNVLRRHTAHQIQRTVQPVRLNKRHLGSSPIKVG